MAVERRKTRRAFIPGMRVVFESAQGQRVEADVLDVGSGGMFIRTAQPVAVGKRLSLEVAPLAGVAAWTALARVVWTRDTGTQAAPPGMGVKLIDVDDAVVAVIDRAVEAREKGRGAAVAVPSRERTVLGLGLGPGPGAANASVQEPAPGDWDVADVHGMTTRVVEVPRVEPEAAPRDEEPPPPSPPPVRAPERSIAIDLIPKKAPVEVPAEVEAEAEPLPQRDSPLPELRPRGGRWVLLLLIVALGAAALYLARDDIPWVKRLVERVTASPPAPTPTEPAAAVPVPAIPSAPSSPSTTAPVPSSAASTVVTWTANRPPEAAPSASKMPVRPPPSASPPAATSSAQGLDNPY